MLFGARAARHSCMTALIDNPSHNWSAKIRPYLTRDRCCIRRLFATVRALERALPILPGFKAALARFFDDVAACRKELASLPTDRPGPVGKETGLS